jgi:flagellar assembly protein FliH
MAQTIQLPKPLRDIRSLAGAVASPSPLDLDTPDRAAYERGRREGEESVRAQLLAQRNEFLELQRGALQSLRDAIPQVVRDTETALITLGIEAAQRLVGGLPVSAEMIEAVVREALSQVEDSAEITVLLNADDLALLQKHQPEAGVTSGDHSHTEFRSSPEVTRGGCIVQTRFGVVDGRRETKTELLKKNLVA